MRYPGFKPCFQMGHNSCRYTAGCALSPRGGALYVADSGAERIRRVAAMTPTEIRAAAAVFGPPPPAPGRAVVQLLNPVVDPYLESAWFQPLNQPEIVISWFQILLSFTKVNLYRYASARRATACPSRASTWAAGRRRRAAAGRWWTARRPSARASSTNPRRSLLWWNWTGTLPSSP
jgi:hypothetical protein